MMLLPPPHRLCFACLGAELLAACASAPPPQVSAPMPTQWRAPRHVAVPIDGGAAAALPHAGSVSQQLAWWQQWNDPLLADLIAAAQDVSPTLAGAAARIAQARAGVVNITATMWPNLDLQAGVTRSPAGRSSIPNLPPSTIVHTGQAGVQLQWEIDAFGGLAHARRAAQARLAGAQAQWHEARVSLAADTASQYFALRACLRTLDLAQQDSASRQDTARLTGILASAGLTAPAMQALADAGAAQAQAQRAQIQTQCTAAVTALVALTALDEETLRQRLDATPVGQPPALVVDAVPAPVLDQRPDVYAAAQAVAAASGDAGQADAARYPRLGLSGSIARAGMQPSSFDAATYSTTWSVGPLAITLPLFDGGRRNASVQAARAQYEAAASQYRASVRNAVREVETALSDLHGAQQRNRHIAAAVTGFNQAFAAANAKYEAGMGSLLELEEARRHLLATRMGQIDLQQQTQAAWVALYRALGGGWQLDANPTEADQALVATGEQVCAEESVP